MTRMKREIRRGFTLIEMLVVIALAALLATVVIVSLAGSYRAARTEDVAGGVAMYDWLGGGRGGGFWVGGGVGFDVWGGGGGGAGGGGGEVAPSGTRARG